MGTYKYLFFTGLFLGMFHLGGMAQSKDSLTIQALTGVWMMDADMQMEKSALESRNSANPLREEHFKGQLESMRSRIYIFHEGGKFESSWNDHGNTQLVNGNWILNNEGILEIELDERLLLSYSVILNKNGLQLIPANPKEIRNLGLKLKRIEP
ncbi:hypothetical protein [Algoriphagus chordae]|uniref:Lipocalin-like protein n=1 Tax=Algoriphagus chordae TaxID=237019 RepID=A0A2W7RCF6_9BACT|nr:hypothetical protein [Algoriphagus chordae]PZX56806.1 hypothetical protein LV85_00739 [Algoriphagus chordae]